MSGVDFNCRLLTFLFNSSDSRQKEVISDAKEIDISLVDVADSFNNIRMGNCISFYVYPIIPNNLGITRLAQIRWFTISSVTLTELRVELKRSHLNFHDFDFVGLINGTAGYVEADQEGIQAIENLVRGTGYLHIVKRVGDATIHTQPALADLFQ